MSQPQSMTSRLAAEFLGTGVLVFGGCGAAIFSAKVISSNTVNMGIGFLGVALAFGLTVLVMVYAVGHISGAHFNPAVTFGAALAGRIEWKAVPSYWITQIAGASVAGLALFAIATGKHGFDPVASGFATNGYADRSPDGYSMLSALLAEIILTAIFLYVILGSTDGRAPKGFAGISIGLSLTLIHLVAIPITNTSVNPARSLGVAWFAGPEALGQVWLFIVAPLVGAAIAGLTYPLFFPNPAVSMAVEMDRLPDEAITDDD
ncbi:aquaporin Z [Paeniglutamicibacter gangotriensis]|uniref:Aquaporin Z n=1 Tax=Paeniglutamicibacter gangotriensis TaxID=254787 RepID=A0A5B0EKW7_9MICC|nr:aquaporin Z [Paeniglutamicibacter gangotriensis]KAA0979443.1 aquaporin Z [Paeniglutamicibacter gangotriensis]